jgi:hypothetical protein
MRAFHSFWSLDQKSIFLINQAYVVLLKTKEDAKEVKDCCPISLVHSFNKLLAKLLARRIASHLHEMVKPNWSTFIKGRSIHDKFMVVQSTTNLLHVRKRPGMHLKIDIAKAFDSVGWAFLIDLLNHYDYSQRWTDWLSVLLSIASTCVLLNGHPGRRICHAHGLRQGDPLSPLLFVLSMEALNTLFRVAEASNFLTPLRIPLMWYIMSLYIDDMVVFISPVAQDIEMVKSILQCFVDASSLHTNLSKCHATPIQYSEQQIELMHSHFPC